MPYVRIRDRCRQGLNKKLFLEEADFELGLEVSDSGGEEGILHGEYRACALLQGA